jgi:hypothetical protein
MRSVIPFLDRAEVHRRRAAQLLGERFHTASLSAEQEALGNLLVERMTALGHGAVPIDGLGPAPGLRGRNWP